MRLRTPSALRRAALPLLTAVAVVAAVTLPLSAAAAQDAAEAATPVIAQPARAVDLDAAFALSLAQHVAADAQGKVDTTTLGVQIAQLNDSPSLPDFAVTAFTGLLRSTTSDVAKSLATYDAEQAQKAAAAQAAAEAAQKLANANTPAGAKETAAAMASSTYGWGSDQFSCLSSLWQKESGWNYKAYNSSGATGIPQALPGSKMASAGSDWATNAATQIAWGLGYIKSVYGSPCSAWAHSQATDWY